MKPQQVDVLLELPLQEANQLRLRGRLTEDLIERMRITADQSAREVGGRLRTDRVPEFTISEGSSPLLGDMLLAASRWWVEVPEGFDGGA